MLWSAQITILELLMEHGPLFGLDLVRLSEGRLSRGSVYTYLAGLEDSGLVTVDVVRQVVHGQELHRRRYTITGDGRRRLMDWSAGLVPA